MVAQDYPSVLPCQSAKVVYAFVREVQVEPRQIDEPRVLERSGTRIHYWLRGPEGRPLVVLTHGAGLDHRMFEPQLAALAAAYRVLHFDLPGHGKSKPVGRRLSVARMAADLEALIDEVGAERVGLVGQSMGGDVCQELVLRRPERISALILIGCLPITRPQGWRERLRGHLFAVQMRLRNLERFRGAVAGMVTTREEVGAYVREAMAAMTRRELTAVWSAIATCVHHEPGYRMPCPLLLVLGEEDGLGGGLIHRANLEWNEREERATLVRIPGAAHTTNLDQPAAVNSAMLEFLAVHLAGPLDSPGLLR